MGPSCVCEEMSVSFGFRVIICRDGNNQFLCIAHPEEHREMTTLTLGSVFVFFFLHPAASRLIHTMHPWELPLSSPLSKF